MLDQYKSLLSFLITSGYSLIPVQRFLNEYSFTHTPNIVILRHDIDRRIHKSIQIADIESEMGIISSFYFRYNALSYPQIISHINSLGHEVGYHYEVMSRSSGDLVLAKKTFEEDLNTFRKLAPVQTVCMHGAPLSRYSNISFWDHFEMKEFDLTGDALYSVRGVEYFTDTGRSWGSDYNLRDYLSGDDKKPAHPDIQKTMDLIEYIACNRPQRLYIVTHPERWSGNLMECCFSFGFDCTCNFGKIFLKRIRELSL